MFLQLLFGPGELVAVHHAAERLPEFGAGFELAELAFLGGESVRVRPRPRRPGLHQRPPCAIRTLNGVEVAEKLAPLLNARCRPAPGR